MVGLIHSHLLFRAAPSEFSCTDSFAVRLTGGRSASEGKLEMCINGLWSAVCGSSDTDIGEAAVVCSQLGYSRSGT